MSLLNRKHLTSGLLVVFGIALLLIFRKVELLSPQFVQETPGAERPLLDVLQWFVIAFAIYIASWSTVGGLNRNRLQILANTKWWDISIILLFGILFRVAMVGSVPIQEIDLYRYVWDGAVVSSGEDPYRYSPKTVLAAYEDRNSIAGRESLTQLCELLDNRPGLQAVLKTIHFGEFTSPYPPVSQYCFAGAVSTCEKRARPFDYVRAMKWMLVIFDIATGIVVVMLLRACRLPMELSIGYWWCPLLIKEVANSGHLDSIVTFFMTLGVLLTIFAVSGAGLFASKEAVESHSESTFRFIPALFSSISFAFAIAAKVFPVIIIPVWFLFLARRSFFKTLPVALLFCASTLLMCWPMARHLSPVKNFVPSLAASYDDPVPDKSGIEAFSKFWEMNDLLYMVVVENLKPAGTSYTSALSNVDNDPDQSNPEQSRLSNEPWFRFTSESFRWQFTSLISLAHQYVAPQGERFSLQHYGFFATRLLTGLTFMLIVAWCCWQVLLGESSEGRFLELTFLTIAWFWLLAPTQNPWYWMWALPFLAFARGRTWFLISGVLFMYYLRFWFDYHYGETIVGAALAKEYPSGIFNWIFPWSQSSAFAGKTFFDFYLPWYEFGPILVLLIMGAAVRWVRPRTIKA